MSNILFAERQRERSNFPGSCDGQSWARQKPGPNSRSHFCCSRWHRRSGDLKPGAPTRGLGVRSASQPVPNHTQHSVPAHILTALAPPFHCPYPYGGMVRRGGGGGTRQLSAEVGDVCSARKYNSTRGRRRPNSGSIRAKGHSEGDTPRAPECNDATVQRAGRGAGADGCRASIPSRSEHLGPPRRCRRTPRASVKHRSRVWQRRLVRPRGERQVPAGKKQSTHLGVLGQTLRRLLLTRR